ncbi:MAG: hypothetical protein LJE95_10520 [Acidobacteria bacterium]|nr:hypothetical protein [Acidobacteriota bacterium]
MKESERELAYYRAVEDLFAELRGVPHTLSPKDFQLLRTWWRDKVPLAAVVSGVTEVFARRREHGEADPVVSLTYCRHAVSRQADHIAEMRVGASAGPEEGAALLVRDGVTRLEELLARAEAVQRRDRPSVAHVLALARRQLSAAADLPPGEVDAYLFALEISLLEGCFHALGREEARELERLCHEAAMSAGDDKETGERVRRTHRDRELRRRLGLPRLELA